jgi:acyl carrier protein
LTKTRYSGRCLAEQRNKARHDKDKIMPKIEIAGWLIQKVATYLALEPDQIDVARPLAEYGLNSVYALTLCGEIEDHFGIPVEPTMAWDYPTVTAMSDYLRTKLVEAR